MNAGSPCLTGIYILARFFFVLHLWYVAENKLQKTFTKIGVEWVQDPGTAISAAPTKKASVIDKPASLAKTAQTANREEASRILSWTEY